MCQYSSATKASISASRSQTSLSATDWTRPALSPRRTLSPQQRTEFVPNESVEDSSSLLGVDHFLVDLPGLLERSHHRGPRDFVEHQAADLPLLRG